MIEKIRRAAEHMPPLRHSANGKAFDIQESEVAKWLCERPEIMQLVFDKARESKAIVYVAEHDMWRGSEWGPYG